MRAPRSFVRALGVTIASMCLVAFFAIAAFAQTSGSPTASPSASASKAPGPPASYYTSYGLMAIVGLAVVLIVAGFLYQAPGFRKAGRGGVQ